MKEGVPSKWDWETSRHSLLLISDKINFKTGQNQVRPLDTDQGTNPSILNTYAPNTGSSNFIKARTIKFQITD